METCVLGVGNGVPLQDRSQGRAAFIESAAADVKYALSLWAVRGIDALQRDHLETADLELRNGPSVGEVRAIVQGDAPTGQVAVVRHGEYDGPIDQALHGVSFHLDTIGMPIRVRADVLLCGDCVFPHE